jgi:hypothetical protein
MQQSPGQVSGAFSVKRNGPRRLLLEAVSGKAVRGGERVLGD